MKKYKLIFAFCFMIFARAELRADTLVTMDITSNTTWTKTNSPYIITKSIDIFKADTLTIEPGVVVEFNNSTFLGQHGALIANGTPDDSILFTSSADSPYVNIYSGIAIESPANSFSYCHFSYAVAGIGMVPTDPYIFPIRDCTFTYCNVGISGYGAAQTISNCLFQYNSVGVAPSGNSSLTISNCLFKYNSVGVGQSGKSIVTLQNCEFDNNETGIYYFKGKIKQCSLNYNSVGVSGGSLINDSGSSIENSTFYYNGRYAITGAFNDTLKNCTIKYNGTGIYSFGNYITYNDISNNTIGIQIFGDNIISCNSICNNTQYNIEIGDNVNDTISNNYWCLTDSASIQATILDGYQDSTKGFLIFMPFDTTACSNLLSGINVYQPEEFNIYPNPTNDILFISSNFPTGEIDVRDLLGTPLIEQPINSNTRTSSIDISHLAKGIYFVTLYSNNQNITKKIIKD